MVKKEKRIQSIPFIDDTGYGIRETILVESFYFCYLLAYYQ